MNNYPPGVTGNEFAIAGPDFEDDHDEPCPKCGKEMIKQGYRGSVWVDCVACDYTEDIEE